VVTLRLLQKNLLVVDRWVVVHMVIKTTISRFTRFNWFFSILPWLSHVIVICKIRSSIDSISTNKQCISLSSLILGCHSTWWLRILPILLCILLSATIDLHQILFWSILHAWGSLILFDTILILNILLVSWLSDSI
jgi:hypothetical protein